MKGQEFQCQTEGDVWDAANKARKGDTLVVKTDELMAEAFQAFSKYGKRGISVIVDDEI